MSSIVSERVYPHYDLFLQPDFTENEQFGTPNLAWDWCNSSRSTGKKMEKIHPEIAEICPSTEPFPEHILS